MQVANKPAITIPGAGGPAGRHVPPALLKKAYAQFKKVDKNGDGALSVDEYVRAKQGTPRDFLAADANHDRKLSFREWAKSKLPGLRPGPRK